jgi:arylsulfatase A-like enzyme
MKRGLFVAGLLVLLAALAWSAARNRTKKRPNLLFISIDTLRADHLGTYGWNRPTSPNLDAFAAKSVVFEQAQSSSSWTLPSLASLMTSLLPSTHHCETDSAILCPSYTTLAEILRDAGYDTAIVASHYFLNAGHGLQQGFTRVDTRILQDDLSITSPKVTDRGIDWLTDKAGAHDGVPWFLWLHYFDPHAPYLRHEGISETFGTEKDIDLYDGEIAFTDQHIGRLFETFERLGFAQDTIVVVVADHGEEFDEHGVKGHGYDLHEEVVHVPLMLRVPGVTPRRVGATIPTVDVLPTLLELCGLRAGADIEGRSLTGILRGDPGSDVDRDAPSECRWKFGDDITSLRRGPWKYIDQRKHDMRSKMLFDHASDPKETTNIYDAQSAVVTELRSTLRARLDRARALGSSYERCEFGGMTPSEREALEKFGYTGEDTDSSGSKPKQQRK